AALDPSADSAAESQGAESPTESPGAVQSTPPTASTTPAAAPPRSAPAPAPPPPRAPPRVTPPPPRPASSAAPTAGTATDGPSAPSPAASPATGPTAAESAFDAGASGAYREISTGLRFRFDVEPEDTLVKIQARGDRSIVQGQVSRFEAGEDDARDLELPAPGDYLITLVHPGHGDIVYFVKAAAGGPTQTIRLSMAAAARQGQASGGGGTVRVSRGVSFSGQPADAVVYVDGARVGVASEWPGTGRNRMTRSRNSLKLDRGRHQIRIEAPGHEPYEMEIVVAPKARQRHFEVVYRLDKTP
ncbi:MAG: hypothetical protein AAFY88_31630, partial [Acidobacteriota bacterium]